MQFPTVSVGRFALAPDRESAIAIGSDLSLPEPATIQAPGRMGTAGDPTPKPDGRRDDNCTGGACLRAKQSFSGIHLVFRYHKGPLAVATDVLGSLGQYPASFSLTRASMRTIQIGTMRQLRGTHIERQTTLHTLALNDGDAILWCTRAATKMIQGWQVPSDQGQFHGIKLCDRARYPGNRAPALESQTLAAMMITPPSSEMPGTPDVQHLLFLRQTKIDSTDSWQGFIGIERDRWQCGHVKSRHGTLPQMRVLRVEYGNPLRRAFALQSLAVPRKTIPEIIA